MRILIADDHDVVRLGLLAALKTKPEWEICGEAVDAHNAISKVKQLRPDVVVLDITMPGMNGFEAAAKMRHISPKTKIILFSIHDVPESARLCGADAFVCKTSGVRELIKTIGRLTSGGGHSSSSSSSRSPNEGCGRKSNGGSGALFLPRPTFTLPNRHAIWCNLAQAAFADARESDEQETADVLT